MRKFIKRGFSKVSNIPLLFWGALFLELILLASLNALEDFHVPGNSPKFVALVLAAGASYLLAIAGFRNIPSSRRPLILWAGAILFRLAVLMTIPGDDIWRYIWEGDIQNHGYNPYLLSPESPALIPFRNQYWAKINHPGFATIYPPGAEIIFAFLAKISLSPLFFKSIFAIADLFIIFLLLRINTGSNRYRNTAWYAWHPSVICSFAGAGHFDSLMILTMVVAIWALHRSNPLDNRNPKWSWAIVSALFLGISISIKIIPLFLLPIWFFALGKRGGVLLLTVAIPYLLSLFYGGIQTVIKPLKDFVYVTRFNDLVWWLIEKTVWANPDQKNTRYNILLAGLAIGLAVIFRKDWRRSVLWVLGAVLILSPVLHPWYVTWILPIACWRKQYGWFILSLSLVISLLLWESTLFWNSWEPNLLLRGAIVLPPLLWLAYWQSETKRRVSVPDDIQ